MKTEAKSEERGTPEAPTIKGWVRCSASPFCRYPGRIWLPGMGEKERYCVEHYSTDKRRWTIDEGDEKRDEGATAGAHEA